MSFSKQFMSLLRSFCALRDLGSKNILVPLGLKTEQLFVTRTFETPDELVLFRAASLTV